jgi:hypothetical protein
MISSEAGTKPDVWFTPWRFAAVLAILIVACFPHVISGLETFFYRDYCLFGYPLAAYHRDSFWRGEIPLWNPLNDCGLPFLAQWNTLTLYPLSLVYLLFPMPWSLNIFCLGHLFLAGMGMYFLARRWIGNPLAAAAAGVIFAYNGLTWHSLMWPNNIAALGWMPWVVLAMERAWRDGGRHIFSAALAGAMQMLAGAPEVILQTWFILGCLWLVQCFATQIPFGKMLGRAITAGLLVAALAAAQLLPFLDLLAHSHRDNSFGDSLWAMPATGWANYLVPLFHDYPAGRGVYVQHDQYWTSSYYVGVGALALALLAVWSVRNFRVWLLAALALFTLTLALGDHGFLYPAIRKVLPQIGFMRYPIKFVVVATFAIPLLAGFGLDRLRARSAADRAGGWKRAGGLGLALVGLIALIICFAHLHPQPSDDIQATTFSGLRSVAFLVVIFGLIALLQKVSQPRSQWILQIVLLVLLWMDVFTHVPNLSPTVSPNVLQPNIIREDQKWQAELRPGESRAMQSGTSLVKMYYGGVASPVEDVLGRRVALYDDINLLDQVPKLDGFYSLYLREFNAVLTGIYTSTNDYPRLKEFLGISHENHVTNAMEWTNCPTFSPLVTAGQQPVFANDTNALRALFDPAFDGRKFVVLLPEAKTAIHATNAVPVTILSTNFSAQRIRAQVDAAAPAMVVLAQAYYHPWRAYVDGQPARLWRANYAFQALEVPAGRHQVEVVYRDMRFIAGSVISIAALLGCAAGWFFGRKRVKSGTEFNL